MSSMTSFFRRRRWPIFVLPCLLFLCFFLLPSDESIYSLPTTHIPPSAGKVSSPFDNVSQGPAKSPTKKPAQSPVSSPAKTSAKPSKADVKENELREEISAYWAELVDTFESNAAKPKIDALPEVKQPPDAQLDLNLPIDERVLYDNLTVTANQTAELQRAHREFLPLAKGLGHRMPYKKGSRGVVMTAGGKYIGVAITAILMLRRSGSNLPVELFLETRKEYKENQDICERTMAKMNSRCFVMEDIWKSSPNMTKQEKYQLKVLAILYSSFQENLLLDADAWPLHKPDILFESQPYKSHGLVTWPDNWLPSINTNFYTVTDTKRPEDWGAIATSESSVIMYNKATHGPSLALAAYYNYYGYLAYYMLLSQRAPGQGDKETFRQAALVMQQPAYQVRTRCTFTGRFYDGNFQGFGMIQADPVEDYQMQMDPKKLAKSTEKYGQDDKTPDLPHARPMFMHHNGMKMDVFNIAGPADHVMRKKEDKYLRLWDAAPQHFDEMVGYDSERVMWEVMLENDCDNTLLTTIDHCNSLKKWYKEIYGERVSHTEGVKTRDL